MKQFYLLVLAFLLFNYSFGQSKYAKDVSSIENLTKAYYDCISGPIGEQRDFERFKNLFHPQAMFTYSYWSEEEQKSKLMIFDIEEYIGKLDYLDKRGFYEEELANQEVNYGSITQSLSTYRFWMEDKYAEGRGVTSYNYFFDGNRYWILSMFWQMESEQFPIPEELLNLK